MAKIIEKIIEPSTVFTKTNFKIKIKVKRGLTYNELKQLTYNQTSQYTYNELKGD